jgi:hypothetical protein
MPRLCRPYVTNAIAQTSALLMVHGWSAHASAKQFCADEQLRRANGAGAC